MRALAWVKHEKYKFIKQTLFRVAGNDQLLGPIDAKHLCDK